MILERPKTHDPRMRTAINSALIRNHQQLLTRLKRINAGKPVLRQPVATAHTNFAVRVE
jgi:hypothetical protein